MGSDNLFHKRKAKRSKDLKRRKAQREPYDRVLIVCEGQKTEPIYFKALIRALRLSSANVEVCGECNSSPKSVLDYAKKKQKAEQKIGENYDTVFCVFDKDQHTTYDIVLHEIEKNTSMMAITSIPCFEFWLLLHFDYTTRPYAGSGGRSPCDEVIADLKTHLPGYTKAKKDIYGITKERIEGAIGASKAVLAAAERNEIDNPSTKVHQLVV